MRQAHALMLAIAVAALAFVPAPLWSQNAKEATIRVIGRATIEAVPDYVTVRIGVSTRAPSPTAALDQNSGAARRVIDFAKSFGIQERDIATDAVNLGPVSRVVREPNGNTRQEPDGYSANNTVRVRLKELGRLGHFLRQVVDQGATNIGGVDFDLSDREQVADEARERAVQDAVRQAERLASAAKVKLGPILEIVHPPRAAVVGGEGIASLRTAKRMAVPIEAGTVQVGAEVDITWAIE